MMIEIAHIGPSRNDGAKFRKIKRVIRYRLLAPVLSATFVGTMGLADPLTMTVNSVAGRSDPVVFDAVSITAAFPDFQVRQFTFGPEHYDPRDGFALMLGDEVIYQIDHGFQEPYIFSVFTTSPRVTGPGGMQVGSTTLGSVPPEAHGECEVGQEILSAYVVCLFWDGVGVATFRASYGGFGPAGPTRGGLETYRAEWDVGVLANMTVFFDRPVQ